MAKTTKLPKKVAGYKVPKSIRKSKLLRALLNNPLGRDVLANALTAGAGAAAAVLVQNREEVAPAGIKGTKKGMQAAGLAGEAAQSAATAMIGVVRDAAHVFCQRRKRSNAGKQAPKKAGRELERGSRKKGYPARSGLPRPVERWLLRRHDETALQRITSTAVMRALGVLLRHYPGAAAGVLGAALHRREGPPSQKSAMPCI